MAIPARLKGFQPSSITGPYGLLATFLAVSEGWLGYWQYRSQSAVERSIVGLVMLLILAGMVYTIIRLKQEDNKALFTSGGEPSVAPPDAKPATLEDLSSPPPETFTSPDRTYQINVPPEGWDVREVSLADWLSNTAGIQDAATKERLLNTVSQSKDIVVFEGARSTSIIPIPGQTTIDGRKIPTALEINVPTQLAILPLEHAQPPLFVERPFQHNFFQAVAQVMATGVMTLQLISVQSGLTAQLEQKIGNAVVNGREGKDAVVTIVIIGNPGTLTDHLLMMKYATAPGDADVARDLATLQSIVASFRPVPIVNANKKRQELAKAADKRFDDLMAKAGPKIFEGELGLLLLRLQNANLDDPDQRLRAMKALKAFEIFARELKLHDQLLDSFWQALHQAEVGGDATEFKSILGELIKIAAQRPPPEPAAPEQSPPEQSAPAQIELQGAHAGPAGGAAPV